MSTISLSESCLRQALLGIAAGLVLMSSCATGQIVDHQALPAVESLPEATLAQIARLRWYFIHASVGDNIMQGVKDLHSMDAAKYPLVVSTMTTNTSPPDSTVAGTVYEHHFSSDKMTQFQSMVTNIGWHSPVVDVALMKFCYLDGLATAQIPGPRLASNYVARMQSLEAAHPATVFVYVSMPLLIYREEGDPRRDPNYLPSIVNINAFNDTLRDYCRSNRKLLYDLADMESHDPAGAESTFVWTNGQSYPVVYAPYVYDTNNPPGANSGHLIAPGRQQVARGWYAVAAAIASNSLAQPRLEWTWQTNRFDFSWSATNAVLQETTNLADALGWKDVTEANQGAYAITNEHHPARFFRLRKL